ncbi:MAG: hypothetical protein J6W40_00100 [Alphaproteobacteria bacterium]|nr:hypothetical protein [Alphaproteobacteria bacterium]
MANGIDCLKYCSLTTEGYNEIVNRPDDVRCPCLGCAGAKSASCDTVNLSAKLLIELDFLQKMRCNKCKYYNGR